MHYKRLSICLALYFSQIAPFDYTYANKLRYHTEEVGQVKMYKGLELGKTHIQTGTPLLKADTSAAEEKSEGTGNGAMLDKHVISLPDHMTWELYGDTSQLLGMCGTVDTSCSSECAKCCDCSSRGLTAIPEDLPTSIIYLDLYNNSIAQLIPSAFSRYQHLRVLYLPHNNLTKLDPHSFKGLQDLETLSLVHNRITMNEVNIPEDVFKPLKQLTKLSLQNNHNDLEIMDASFDYPDKALSGLKTLTSLSIDGLKNKAFGPGFRSLTSLKILSAAGFITGKCKMITLTNETFINLNMTSLKVLNISDCFIQGNRLDDRAFHPLQSLETLDLTWNEDIGLDKLSNVLCAINDSNINWLLINNVMPRFCLAFNVNVSHVKCLPKHIETLEAEWNCIQMVDEPVFDALPRNLSTLKVGNNRFVFGKYINNWVNLTELRNLTLNGGSFIHNIPTHWPYIVNKEFSSYTGHDLQSTMEEDQIYNNDDRGTMMGHRGLYNQHDPSEIADKPFIFQLPPKLDTFEMSEAGLRYTLSRIEFDQNNELKTLKINANYFPVAKGPFIGLHNLTNLEISNAKLGCIEPLFFNNTFPSLTDLDLSYNNLGDNKSGNCDTLKPVFSSLHSLRRLNLGNNKISKVLPNLFIGLDKLEYLTLRYNPFWELNDKTKIDHMVLLRRLDLHKTALPSINVTIRRQIDAMPDISVDLSGAPIRCDCDNMDFLDWMTTSRAFMKEINSTNTPFHGYICVVPGSTDDKPITDGYLEVMRILKRECVPHITEFIATASASVLMLVLIVAAILYRFRWNLRFFYYAAYQNYWDDDRRPTDRGLYDYDVFLSYAFADEEFVVHTLDPALTSRGLRVLIHGRDFTAGDYIASNIVKGVKRSRRTLVVLTQSLVESHWCTYEMQMAHMEASDSGRPVLVFLLMEKIPKSRVGADLLAHINSNTYTAYPPTAHRGRPHKMEGFWAKLADDLRG